jgi:hypothetical protein
MKLSGAIRRRTSRTSKDEEKGRDIRCFGEHSHGHFQNPVNAIFISLAIFSPVIESAKPSLHLTEGLGLSNDRSVQENSMEASQRVVHSSLTRLGAKTAQFSPVLHIRNH